MIATMLRIGWLNLKRDGLALALTFVVPIALFSVFALVFGSMDEGTQRSVRVAVLNRSASPRAEALVAGLNGMDSLEVLELTPDAPPGTAEERVRLGQVSLAVVIPPTFGETENARVQLLADTSNPVALAVVRGAVHTALPAALSAGPPAAAPPSGEPSLVEVVDVLGRDGRKPSIAFFAAGIGVMFLLFAVIGRSGILIDERESGVLLRMLTSQLGLGRLLVGRWLYLAILGALQVTAMFVWGALVFGLELFQPRHLAGFTLMTMTTAAAAAAFALVLAVSCKTRAQLNGVAVVLVLIMSAVGGSMFPRFLMPENLQTVGRLTFNAWALDGYRKVFWYEARPVELLPELAVLVSVTLVFFTAAVLLARRWQRA